MAGDEGVTPLQLVMLSHEWMLKARRPCEVCWFDTGTAGAEGGAAAAQPV